MFNAGQQLDELNVKKTKIHRQCEKVASKNNDKQKKKQIKIKFNDLGFFFSPKNWNTSQRKIQLKYPVKNRNQVRNQHNITLNTK